MEDPTVRRMRRTILALASTSIGLATLSALFVARDLVPKASQNPDRLPPQVGDQLVYATGHKEGTPISPQNLPLGGPFFLAYPRDPKTLVIRNGNPQNTLLVIRLDPKDLAPQVARYAANGVVVYSALCTHLGCIVSLWHAQTRLAQCPCHGGEYNLAQDQVVSGPPPRPLPLLSIREEGGFLTVAGTFTGPVGPQAG